MNNIILRTCLFDFVILELLYKIVNTYLVSMSVNGVTYYNKTSEYHCTINGTMQKHASSELK